MEAKQHTIVALVEDRPGVLNRIASLFRRRGYNIASLAVGPSEEPSLSRMTFVVEGDNAVVEQVTKQLNKLIDVVKVIDISQEETVTRELALIKVKAKDEMFFRIDVQPQYFDTPENWEDRLEAMFS